MTKAHEPLLEASRHLLLEPCSAYDELVLKALSQSRPFLIQPAPSETRHRVMILLHDAPALDFCLLLQHRGLFFKGPSDKGRLRKSVGKLSVALFASICPTSFCKSQLSWVLVALSFLEAQPIMLPMLLGSQGFWQQLSARASVQKPCGKSGGSFVRKVRWKLCAESPAEVLCGSPAETLRKVMRKVLRQMCGK